VAAADDFLEAAESLVVADTPGLGHWRRSISTSYYAAFHAVVECSVLVVIKPPSAQLEARSWFDHGPMADVATSLGQAPSDPNKLLGWLNSGGRSLGFDSLPSSEEVDFGERYRSLYDQRQLADYFKHGALGLGEGDARTALANARSVVSQTKSWLATANPNFEKIAFAMLEKSIKVRKR
jgi:hypothetical protein